MKKIVVSSLFIGAAMFLSAGNFSEQADKDRKALQEYFEKKFADRKNANIYFPYSTKKELDENFKWGIKGDEFRLGSYAFNKSGKAQYDEINEMPPYEDAIDEGKELYEKTKFKNGKSFKNCFPDPAIAGDYPKYVKGFGVQTLTVAINECLKANGEKPWNMKKGKMTKLQAYFAAVSKEKGKKINIVIDSKEAQEAYERGKKEYYSQRGYLKLSCASCHVQGAGQRVRNEYMSPLFGQVTHFPVYRLKWEDLGTLERRLEGCNKDQGENPHKAGSKWMNELAYFMAYMSNGMPVDGPDIRK
jgi:sulfur-oxidizing protein SoxA